MNVYKNIVCINVVKYMLVGVCSAILCWLPWNAMVFESFRDHFAILFFLIPGTVLAVVILVTLKVSGILHERHYLVSLMLLIVFCVAGWMLAICLSASGTNITMLASTKYYFDIFSSGIAGSVVGTIFTGFAIDLCLTQSLPGKRWVFYSSLVCATTIGFSIYCIFAGPFAEEFRYFLKSHINPPLSGYPTELSSFLILFMSWQIALFSCFPILLRRHKKFT